MPTASAGPHRRGTRPGHPAEPHRGPPRRWPRSARWRRAPAADDSGPASRARPHGPRRRTCGGARGAGPLRTAGLAPQVLLGRRNRASGREASARPLAFRGRLRDGRGACGPDPGTERGAIQTLPPPLNAERRPAGDARSRNVGAPAGSTLSSIRRPANRPRGASFDTVQLATTGGRCPRRSQPLDPVSRTSRRRSERRRGSWRSFPDSRSSCFLG